MSKLKPRNLPHRSLVERSDLFPNGLMQYWEEHSHIACSVGQLQDT